MKLDPSKYRVLLVGPRCVHLKPFFERRGFKATAFPGGKEALAALDEGPRDLVVLELNLGELTAQEFLQATRKAHAATAYLLLDDASKAGQIVKALQQGVDVYLPTPPDEERLFQEVERQIIASRARGGATLVDGRELERLHAAVAEKDGRLVELSMQQDLVQQEMTDLRERVAGGAVLEKEVETLREELAAANNLRRELGEELDVERRRSAERGVQHAQSALALAEAQELIARIPELEAHEARNAQLESRVSELETDLAAVNEERREAEEKLQQELADARREAKRATTDRASDRGEIERVKQEHAAEMVKLTAAHSEKVEKLTAHHGAELTELRAERDQEARDHDAALLAVRADAEKLAAARADELVAAATEKLQARIDELQQALTAAEHERDEAVEKSLDAELNTDELKSKIEFFQGEAEAAAEKTKAVEAQFKRDKLRLVEEKEEAVAAAQQSIERLQMRVDELNAAKRTSGDVESQLAAAVARLKAAEQKAEEAAKEKDAANAEQRTALAERQRAEGKAAELERANEKLAAEVQRERQSAMAAAKERDEVRSKQKDAEAARATSEGEAARAKAKAQDVETQLAKERAAHEKAVKDHPKELERERAAVAKVAVDRDAERARAADAESKGRELEERLGRALAAAQALQATTPPAASDEEVEKLRARLVEGEQWIKEAQAHIDALAAERDQLADAAREPAPRSVADQRLIDELTVEVKRLADDLVAARAAPSQPVVVGSPFLSPQAAEAAAPLTWGLEQALAYLSGFEQRDPLLAGHVRTLRLLAATLTKLQN